MRYQLEHALTDAEMKLLEAGHVHSGIEKEHRNQTHMVDHQPRANLIVEKRKVNKVNSNSEVNNKGKTTNNMKSKANKHAGIMDRFDTRPSFVLIKGSKLSRQLDVNMVVAGSSGASTLGAIERPLVEGWYYIIPGIEVNTIVKFRDVVLLKDVFSMKIGIPSSVSLDDSLASTSIPEHVEKMSNVRVNPSSTSLTYDKSNEIRWSKRARVVKDFGSDFVTYNIEDDPVTFTDVIASSKAKQLKEAVKIEMDFIVSNGTWVLVDLSLGCTTIGCK
ncbi:UNVERIFIED_CONTAM: hypothetical protein Sangu_2518900 [Sesamum angustifolium]|uniref:Uncharacterized protein n=1 Tax=Sesamum angustifolium TaxID=2727405 RepID=A0AAW2JKP0_9LAMI